MLHRRLAGFTLIEVLVAAAILGALLPALMLLMMQQTDYAGLLRDKTIAHWIAENKAVEMRLTRENLQRERVETLEMAGVEWSVAMDTEKLASDQLIKRNIRVGKDPDKPLVVLELYFALD